MKKKNFITPKDKKDWFIYTENPKDIYDKEKNYKSINEKIINVPKLDLHGYSLNEANKLTKEFIIKYKNLRKLIIITGKGLRSKNYKDPYVSSTSNILKNSIPEYILSDSDLLDIVDKISKAEIKDGGDGAIYVYLKKL